MSVKGNFKELDTAMACATVLAMLSLVFPSVKTTVLCAAMALCAAIASCAKVNVTADLPLSVFAASPIVCKAAASA